MCLITKTKKGKLYPSTKTTIQYKIGKLYNKSIGNIYEKRKATGSKIKTCRH